MAGAIADQLDDYHQARPESFLWDNLPCSRDFRNTLDHESTAEVEKKEGEATHKLVMHSLDEVLANATTDQGRHACYLTQKRCDTEINAMKSSRNLRTIQEQGDAKSKKLQETRFSVAVHSWHLELMTGQTQRDIKLRPQQHMQFINNSLREACAKDCVQM